jgi:hypothetical protein
MGMRLPTRWLCADLWAFAALAWAATARADLAPSSPFIPAGSAAASAQAGPSSPIELRGEMATSEGVSYCIYDTAKKKDVWVGLNEAGHDFVVKTADPATDSVTVDYQGRSLLLTLRTAKVASSGPPPTGAPEARGPQPNPSLASSVVLNPTAADEQRRLDAVAQEVRRRRMERERAAMGAQNGLVPGQPPPAPNR